MSNFDRGFTSHFGGEHGARENRKSVHFKQEAVERKAPLRSGTSSLKKSSYQSSKVFSANTSQNDSFEDNTWESS